MEEKDGIYYHIHKQNKFDDLWQIGGSLEFCSPKNNEFFEYYETSEPAFRIQQNFCGPVFAANRMLELTPILNQQDYINFVHWTGEVFIETGMYIREVIFEEERKKIDVNFPSRLNCIWVCRKEQVKFWYEKLGKTGVIAKVRLNGKSLACDQEYVYRELLAHKTVRENAFKYWESHKSGLIKDEEILFEGTVSILDLYKSIEEFEKE